MFYFMTLKAEKAVSLHHRDAATRAWLVLQTPLNCQWPPSVTVTAVAFKALWGWIH
jgi:hypothetical protein